MLHAKVKKAFPGAPDNSRQTINWKPGDVVKGDLARVAIENGWAVEHNASKPAETKSGNEQPSSASQQAPASQQKTAKQRGKDK